MSDDAVRVLVVNHQSFSREALCKLLEEHDDIHVVGSVDETDAAIAVAREQKPAVVVVYAELPNDGALQTTSSVIELDPKVGVLVVTSMNGPTPAQAQAGALGFVAEPEGIDAIVTALRAVARGEEHLSPELTPPPGPPAIEEDEDPFLDLKDRELQVALMLVQQNDVAAIAKRIRLAEDLVLGYRDSLFRTLRITTIEELIALAIRHGHIEP